MNPSKNETLDGAKTPQKPYTLVDLFAGCGGLSLGLEHAGFQPVFVNEIHPDALQTYQDNRENHYPYLKDKRFYSHDVKELVMNKNRLNALQEDLMHEFGIGTPGTGTSDLDLLVGGPPCQGYSGIGHRRSYSVDKEQLPSNHLCQDMAYLINVFQPKIFLFENVRGLLNARWTPAGTKGEIWADVEKTFTDIDGYDVRHSLILSKDYGIPQNRPRILLVGIRKDLSIKINDDNPNFTAGGLLPHPSDSMLPPPNLDDLLGDLIDPEYKNGEATNKYPHDAMTPIQRELRGNPDGGLFEKGDPLTDHEYSKHSPHVREKFRHMIKNGGRIPPRFRTKKFSQKVLMPRWGEKGPNITVTSLADDYVHWAQPRSLTVREWARMQTFPDWYQFRGKRTTGGIRRAGNPRESIHSRELPKYTQIGNAVPVQLARILGQHFSTILR